MNRFILFIKGEQCFSLDARIIIRPSHVKKILLTTTCIYVRHIISDIYRSVSVWSRVSFIKFVRFLRSSAWIVNINDQESVFYESEQIGHSDFIWQKNPSCSIITGKQLCRNTSAKKKPQNNVASSLSEQCAEECISMFSSFNLRYVWKVADFHMFSIVEKEMF